MHPICSDYAPHNLVQCVVKTYVVLGQLQLPSHLRTVNFHQFRCLSKPCTISFKHSQEIDKYRQELEKAQEAGWSAFSGGIRHRAELASHLRMDDDVALYLQLKVQEAGWTAFSGGIGHRAVPLCPVY